MGRRRGGGVAEFFDGFNSAYQTVGKILQDKEMRDIAKAEEVDNSGFTEDQGKQLEEAAAAGNAVTYDEGKKSYVITPAGGGEASDVAMARKGVTFLGKDYENPLSDSDKDKARMQAMAGVYSKHGDPMKAMEMKSKAQQAEMTGMQLDGMKRAGEFEKGWGEMWKNTPIAKAAAEQRDPSVGDQMATVASMMEYKAKHGKLNPEELMSYTEKMTKLKDENYASAMRVLNAGGSPESVAAEFNKAGKMQLDPSQMSIRPVTVKVNGKDIVTHELTFMQDGKAHVVNGFRELDGLGKADAFFSRQMQANADTRGDKSLDLQGAGVAMAQATHAAGAPGRANTQEAAKLQAVLAGTKDPKERAAITQKINDLTGAGGADANAPAEVKLASAFVKAGLAGSMADGLKMATQGKDLSPEKMRFEIYKTALTAHMGDAKRAKEVTDEVMSQFGGKSAGGERTVGMEQVIQSGPNKGKTAVWDGKGWVVKG